MATKTIKQWFNTLKEPYKTQAINNTDKAILECITEDINNALEKAFTWSRSSEGHYYWSKLNQEYYVPRGTK